MYVHKHCGTLLSGSSGAFLCLLELHLGLLELHLVQKWLKIALWTVFLCIT